MAGITVASLSPEKRRLLAGKLEARKRASKIPPRARRTGPAPLSFAQQRLWFLQQLDPDSTQYSLPAAVRVEGPLDTSALERGLATIARRHESLRTVFSIENGEPVQVVEAPASFSLPVLDVHDDAELESRIRAEAASPFDLARGPLFRASVLRRSASEHFVLMNAHHIISDSWSAGILVRELLSVYEAISSGRTPALPFPSLQYADYAAWQREPAQQDTIAGSLAYWRERLSGNLPVIELPSDRPRPVTPTFRGGLRTRVLAETLSKAVRMLSQQEGATPFMTYLAAFKALLVRYTGQSDLIVGSPVSGRSRAETHPLIGCFVNTIALRTDCSGDPTFRDLLGRVRETCLTAYEHEDAPFERVVESLQLKPDLSRSPVFQVAFGVRQDPVQQFRLGSTTFEMLDTHTGMSKFDLMLEVVESAGHETVAVEYSADLFDSATIDRLLGHFETLVAAAADQPSAPVSRLALLTSGEVEALRRWNETTADYPLDRCLHEFIEDQAKRTPDAIAVRFEQESVTYRELDLRANRLANYLQKAGVGPGLLVGVAMERSVELVVSLLAILKAGGAYVPIDPEYPADRIAFMLADSAVSILLIDEQSRDRLPAHAGRAISVGAIATQLEREPETAPVVGVSPDDFAYMIYTSGSTGRPKGALNGHRGIVNRLCWMQDAYGLDASDRILQKTPFSFDVSVWEFFWPLMTGATLVVARPGGHRDAAYLARLIAREGVTTMHFVPSMLQIFLDEPSVPQCRSLRRVICSGEALPFDLQQRFFDRLGAELHNLYGPTEAAVDVTFWQCEPAGNLRVVPIGRPIRNIQIHLLDSHRSPVPVGVAGELYIGGVGVGLGYWNRPELTAEKFLSDPFRDNPGARVYRTGDLARYLPDGAIEYLGRIDHQVKIRGFRIELGEIESLLNQHPSVRESVVVAIADNTGDKRLAAYVTASGDDAPANDTLRAHLAASLPEYMVPSTFVVLPALPLSPNGKVDRRALPQPEFVARSGQVEEHVDPRTPAQELLAQIWSEALNVPRVGALDNFFALGGHSLLAARVISKIRSAFGVELPVRRIFEFPTLEALAGQIELLSRAGTTPPVTPRSREHAPALSFAQQRLWLLDQLVPGDPVYHLPIMLRLGGALDRDALERALNGIVSRHEVLRTAFPVVNGVPVQQIHDRVSVPLPVREAGADLSAIVLDEIRQPFDLARGPLLRAALMRVDADDHVLVVTMHHIVSDGWSIGVFLRELESGYSARPLPELAVQYADYAMWQRDWLAGDVFDTQMEYWGRQLEGLPMLNLPSDHPRPKVPAFRGARRRAELPPALAGALRQLARREGATLFMVLLAGFQALLSRLTGQTDIAVGTPVANRNRAEIEDLIGFFVNSLVLRTRLDGDPSFSEILSRVRQVSLGAYANQDLPFERLVEQLRPDRDIASNPLFQVAFTVRDLSTTAVNLPGLSVEALDAPEGIAKFDLMMEIQTGGPGLCVDVEYDTALFDTVRIDRLLRHFETLIQAAVANPLAPLSQLPLLTEAERTRHLIEWNNTATDYPRDQSIPELFEQQVRARPDAMAVEFGGTRWTYRELDQRANQIAGRIARVVRSKEALVAICMERSAAMVAATLGVLKAGCAYVPLDATYPAARLRFMIEDSGTGVVVTEPHLAHALGEVVAGLHVISIDSTWAAVTDEPPARPDATVHADDLAYVMYTSGSTGQPKGIAVPQRAIARLVLNTDYVQLGTSDRIAQVSNISFDASTFEIWGALLNGGCLVGIDKDVVLSPATFATTLAEQRITTMFLTVALFNQMARTIPSAFGTMRNLLFGGDAADAAAVREVLCAGGPERLINGYGPTEATTFAAWHLVRDVPEDAVTVPIGRPIANTTLFVLDANLQPLPEGVPGELYIGGDGLARGYWNQPDLTGQRFVANPLDPHGRLYRTGDLVCRREDGTLDYLGRLDKQVKIRGFRIELGEIEAALLRHSAIREAVVVDRQDTPGDKRLVAYFVCDSAAPPRPGELRDFLNQRLPDYMVPSAFVAIDALPITANGKIDRAALPSPEAERPDLGNRFSAPRTPREFLLADIWSSVLNVHGIGVNDNFFTLGGHSLLATQVASRIREVLGIEVPLRTLFEAQTIAELASRLHAGQSVHAAVQRRLQPDSPAPLSYAQQRLWFLDQLMPANALYNVPAAVRLNGDLNIDALERAVLRIVERHEALRTTFPSTNGAPVQLVSPRADFGIARVDLSGLADVDREAEVRERSIAEARRPFDLATGPLIRATLLHLSAEEHVLLLTLHHIVCDGWSIGVLVREVAACYAAFAQGESPRLAPLAIQYADYASWQREYLTGETLDAKLGWWKERLAGNLGVLELPADRPRPTTPSFAGGRYARVLSPAVLQSLKEISQESGATLFMTLLAAFKAFLYRATGQQDVIVGSPIAGRDRAEIEPLIGFFVNTLVLRTDLSGNPAFRELLDRVRETSLGSYAHQDVPFEMLVDTFAPDRDRRRNPLFQVAFVLQNAPAPAIRLPELEMAIAEADSGTAKFDLTLVAEETARGLALSMEYGTDLFERETVVRLMNQFETLLDGAVANPNCRLSELPLLTAQERQQLVVDWNRTAVAFPDQLCAHQWFEQQAARTPDAPAVVFGDEVLSYGELNRRANRLAHALRRRGVGPEALVGVALDRSVAMIVAILGVMKAGGAYLPIAVDQPVERISFVLNDAGPRIVVSNAEIRERLSECAEGCEWLLMDDAQLPGESAENPASDARPENLAYVIYTSGSTGRPKGVLLEHRGLVNLAQAQGRLFQVGPTSRVLQFAANTFDASVSEIFVTLLNGGTLFLARREQMIGEALAELMRREDIDIVTLPPTVLATLADNPLPRLRTLVVAGEACGADLIRHWSTGRRMLNAYGPTEATVCATAWMCDAASTTVSIGRPIDNTRVYVVDAEMRPVPLGSAGELVIGGVGVARGYLRRPELTRQRFLPDPFSSEPGARVYRTGDRVRYLADGHIEFLGRMDRQIKIRGFRIEPGEIEAALREQESVRDAVVIDREDVPGNRRVVAYVSARDGVAVSPIDLRSALQMRLPDYMVPAAIVVLDELPLTAHGKVDRAALPAPGSERPDLSRACTMPRNATEETLAGVWKEVLGLDQVGIHDNFFELGGDSILTIQVVARAGQRGLRLAPRDVFDRQTIAELAAAAEFAAGVECEQGAVSGAVPLTPIQHWFFEQNLADAHHWNQAVLLELTQAPDVAALTGALRAVVEHHDVLRSRFTPTEAGWQQTIDASSDHVPLEIIDLSTLPAHARIAEMERLASDAQAAIDLAHPPLVRAVLFDLGDLGWRLLVAIHHLVVDGVSWRTVLEDMHVAYDQLRRGEATTLPRKTTSFQHWARKLQEYAASETVTREAEYWLSSLAETPRLPVDLAGENTRERSSSVSVSFTAQETEALLRDVPKAYGTQINDALLTALAEAFARWTGQRSLLVDLEGHGREDLFRDVDLSRTAGWFTTVYPVRLELPAGVEAGENLKAVKEQLRRVPRNGISYGLARYLAGNGISRQLAALAPAQVSFNYLGQFDASYSQASAFRPAAESCGQSLSPRGARRHFLEFNGNVLGGQLHITCVYSRSIHSRATVEGLVEDFAVALRALIAHCASPEAGGFTPSDFPLAGLDEKRLDKLTRLVANKTRAKVRVA